MKKKLTEVQSKRVENKIKNLLREKGFKQKQIAEALDMDEAAFSKKLRNPNSFDLYFLYELADKINVSIYDLIPEILNDEPTELQRGKVSAREEKPISYKSLALMLFQLKKQASSPYTFNIVTRQQNDLTIKEAPHMEINVYGKEFYYFFQALDMLDLVTGFSIEATDLETAYLFKESLLPSYDYLIDSLPDTPMKNWTPDQYYYYGKLLDAGVKDRYLDIWSEINDWDQSEPFIEYIKPQKERLRRIYGDSILPNE